MRVVYEGPSPGVWLPDGTYAPRGEHTDVSDDLAKRLDAQSVFTVAGSADASYPQHVGGGWYATSDGQRVQGEDTARAHEQALQQPEHDEED